MKILMIVLCKCGFFLLHKQDESTFQTFNIQTKIFVIVKNYNINKAGKHYLINRSLSLKLLHKVECEHEMQIFGIINPFSIDVVLNFKTIFTLIVANINFTNLPPHALRMFINYGCLFLVHHFIPLYNPSL
jgi:hypothetical protein